MKRPANHRNLLTACLALASLAGAGESLFSEEAAAPSEVPPDPAEEAAVREAEDRALRMKAFDAVLNGRTQELAALIDGGLDPNATLPVPVTPEYARRFTDDRLRYYVTREKDFTALMMAAALGDDAMVRLLLAAGAEPYRMTRRHRTYALWLAAKYGHLEVMRSLMGIGPDHEANAWRVEVDLAAQKAWLWHDGKIILFTPISSGRKSHPTPTGRFLVTDKYRKWKSTLYDARMPFFLRLSCGDFGLHQGVLPGRPASHGCIRLPERQARELFAKVPVGTLVEIK